MKLLSNGIIIFMLFGYISLFNLWKASYTSNYFRNKLRRFSNISILLYNCWNGKICELNEKKVSKKK